MEKIKEYIKKHKLIEKGEIIGVGVSGGSDSMCLLHCLSSLQDEMDFEVVAIHVNHGIREESRDEARFVLEECKKMQVRAYKFKIDALKIAKESNQSIETSAREGRFNVFASLVKKGVVDKIALAHHESDQAETILMHLFRGSGLNGMKGMEPVRDKIYIRPMLECTKQEISDYLINNEVDYVVDRSNEENEYNRNFLRNVVLKEIKKRWPNVESSILNLSKDILNDDKYINSMVCDDSVIYDKNTASIPASLFLQPLPVSTRIIQRALKNIGVLKDIERKHFEIIKLFAIKGENGKKINLPCDIVLAKEYDYVTLVKKEKKDIFTTATFKPGETKIQNYGKLIIQKDIFEKNSDKLFFDFKKVPKTACWRLKKDGDLFEKFGGGTKKLKDFLIDKKIPLRERKILPVLADGKEVFIIAGIEISNKIKVDEKSKIFSLSVKKI